MCTYHLSFSILLFPHPPHMFIKKFPRSFNKKLLFELLTQFAPIEDFYFSPSFSIVKFKTKKDLDYAHEMLRCIKGFKVEVSSFSTVVEVENVKNCTLFRKMISKFGSVKFKGRCLVFKKEEAARRAVECCSGRFIMGRRVGMRIIHSYNE